MRELSDLKNRGKDVILVSSGAIGVGTARMGLPERPRELRMKQAAAAVGQCRMMHMYDTLFSEYNRCVAQILLTGEDVEAPIRAEHLRGTFGALLEMKIIPVVNENDSVSIDELTKFGGNDILSAHVAQICKADLLLNLSDVDGLYDSDPRDNPDARLIDRVEDLDALTAGIGGAGSERGTGGMVAKLQAAKLVTEQGIPMFILNGHDPEILYTLLDGGHVGTYFTAKKK